MKLLLIGGNGFIGAPLIAEVHRAGHALAVLHRRCPDTSLPADVLQISGDRNRLPDHLDALRRFSPDVIIDLILSSENQARQLIDVSRALTSRVVALSSMDVYRAWGVLLRTEPGPLEPLPLTEDSPLRTVRRIYPAEAMKRMRNIFSWLDDNYDKIGVEESIISDPALRGTILRLPMVYGPGDHLHRFFPVIKRIADGRLAILLADDLAAWRGPRGYVENIAHAIAIAATSEHSAGRIYNVCEEPTLSEFAWQEKIAQQLNWPGKFVLLPRQRTPKHLLQPGNASQHVVATSDRIRSEHGYQEPVDVEESIRRTIAWEQQNPPAIINPQEYDYEAEDAALASAA